MSPVRPWEERLARRLLRDLPGLDGQLRLSPTPRRGWVPGHIPDDHRLGAGLLLLYPYRGQPHVLLTLRSEDLGHHANQVSFPGGSVEPGETLEAAALREANEEVGLPESDVRILGALTPLHIPVSGFVLHTLIGVTHRRPEFQPDPSEVAEVLEVPLSVLQDEATLRTETRTFKGNRYRVPFFDVDGKKVWGATAMILSEFLALTEEDD